MKKLIALSTVLVILAGAGFAEVAVTGQVDVVVMPLQVVVPDKGDALIGAGVGRNGSGDAPRARIGVTATNDTKQVGINFKLQFNPNAAAKLGIDDFAEVWWQPISQLKIEAGKFVNDTLRGKIGDDNWQRYTVGMKDPDHIFSRFKSNWSGTVGFMLGITPIEPLYIGVSVPGLDQFTAGFPDTTGFYYKYDGKSTDGPTYNKEKVTKVGNVAHTYEKIQVGLGYTIANIGLVRAQYVGASHINPEDQDLWKDPLKVRRIEAAFAFTGMEGLVVDVGGKIPLAFNTYEETETDAWDHDEDDKTAKQTLYFRTTDGYTYQAPFQASLGVGFTGIENLDIKARVDAQLLGSRKKDNTEFNIGPYINVHLWPSYNLGFATAGLDVGFEYIGADTDKDGNVQDKSETSSRRNGGTRFGIGAWLKKSYGGASIKGGLAYHLASEVHSTKEPGVFSIPIIFDYTF
jgi:hypothetical protein